MTMAMHPTLTTVLRRSVPSSPTELRSASMLANLPPPRTTEPRTEVSAHPPLPSIHRSGIRTRITLPWSPPRPSSRACSSLLLQPDGSSVRYWKRKILSLMMMTTTSWRKLTRTTRKMKSKTTSFFDSVIGPLLSSSFVMSSSSKTQLLTKTMKASRPITPTPRRSLPRGYNSWAPEQQRICVVSFPRSWPTQPPHSSAPFPLSMMAG
mmetsp:Transcript_17814/g.42072  ORF Transcript_17814/g.42072 Transcript_17814/m.42072 type:complete len:208 (-) Transcript_17814:1368-1991(-)